MSKKDYNQALEDMDKFLKEMEKEAESSPMDFRTIGYKYCLLSVRVKLNELKEKYSVEG